jgi:hypothetical protein
MKEPGIVDELAARLFKAHSAYCEEYNLTHPCSVPMEASYNEIVETMP